MHVIWQWVFSGTGGRALQLEERAARTGGFPRLEWVTAASCSTFGNLILIQSGISSD
jgi:hypothetical protein